MLDLLKKTLIVNISLILLCNAPDFWQLRLQDPASSIMEKMLLFNEHLLFIASMIAILKGRLLFSLILNSGNVSWEFILSSKLSKQTKNLFSLLIVKTIIILMFNSFLFLSVKGFLNSSLLALSLGGGFGFLISVVIFYKPKLKRFIKKLVFWFYQWYVFLLLRSLFIIEKVSTVIFSYFAVNLFLNVVGMFLNGTFLTPDSIMDLFLQLSQRDKISHEGFSYIEKFCMFADNQDSSDASSNTADVPNDLSDNSIGSAPRFDWDSGVENLNINDNSTQNNDTEILNNSNASSNIADVPNDLSDNSIGSAPRFNWDSGVENLSITDNSTQNNDTEILNNSNASSNIADVPNDLSDNSIGSTPRFNWGSGVESLSITDNSTQNNDTNIVNNSNAETIQNSTSSVQDVNLRTVSQDTEDSSVAPSPRELLAQERRGEIAKVESDLLEFFEYWDDLPVQEFERNYGRSDSEFFQKLRTEVIAADARNQYKDGSLLLSKKDIGEELSEGLTNYNKNLELVNFGTSVMHEKLKTIDSLVDDFESEFDEPYKSPNNFDTHKHKITKKIRYYKGLKIKPTDAIFPRPRTGS
nr:hypothetical protein [Navicula sp.]